MVAACVVSPAVLRRRGPGEHEGDEQRWEGSAAHVRQSRRRRWRPTSGWTPSSRSGIMRTEVPTLLPPAAREVELGRPSLADQTARSLRAAARRQAGPPLPEGKAIRPQLILCSPATERADARRDRVCLGDGLEIGPTGYGAGWRSCSPARRVPDEDRVCSWYRSQRARGPRHHARPDGRRAPPLHEKFPTRALATLLVRVVGATSGPSGRAHRLRLAPAKPGRRPQSAWRRGDLPPLAPVDVAGAPHPGALVLRVLDGVDQLQRVAALVPLEEARRGRAGADERRSRSRRSRTRTGEAVRSRPRCRAPDPSQASTRPRRHEPLERFLRLPLR